MFKVHVTSLNLTFEFATHAEASRCVRGLHAKRVKGVKLVTLEVRNDEGRLGGYGRVGLLRPVHCTRG